VTGSALSCAALWRDLEAYRDIAAQADDVTLVALRREPGLPSDSA
jgi:hypothetical protein